MNTSLNAFTTPSTQPTVIVHRPTAPRTGATVARTPRHVRPPQPSSYFKIKRWVDRALVACLMLAGLPLLVTISALVLVIEGRPIFYRQVRVGKRGRLFWIWKFRTMTANAEQYTGPVWSNSNDPRITKLGRWLRCTHLDELPQLLNVLSGDMNLIGPRPERPEFVRELATELPHYLGRIVVRPGITGLSQLRLGYDQSVLGVRKKIAGDLKYIRTATWRGDLALLLATIPYLAHQSIQALSSNHTDRRIASDVDSDEPTTLVAATGRTDRPASTVIRSLDSQVLVRLDRPA